MLTAASVASVAGAGQSRKERLAGSPLKLQYYYFFGLHDLRNVPESKSMESNK